MTEWSPAELKSAWTRLFLKSGGNGEFTRLFADLPATVQEPLLSDFPVTDAEAPVFGSYHGEDAVLVTTARVSWKSSGVSREVAIASIRDVTVDVGALMRAGTPKRQWDELQIVTLTGERQTLRLEPGRPFIGIWNALKFIPGKRRSAPPSDTIGQQAAGQ